MVRPGNKHVKRPGCVHIFTPFTTETGSNNTFFKKKGTGRFRKEERGGKELWEEQGHSKKKGGYFIAGLSAKRWIEGGRQGIRMSPKTLRFVFHL